MGLMHAPSGPAPVIGIDERPPFAQAVPLGLQHLVAMLLGNITPPLIIAGGLGLEAHSTAFLLQIALVMAGLATLVQAYPLGPVGGRIPIVMGTSFAFVGGILLIGKSHGLAAVFGACLAAAIVEVVLGFSIDSLKRLFPPLVNSIVVMLIGLTLIPIGVDYAAGGVGAADYGSLINLGLAALAFTVTLALHQFGRGFLRYASVLCGVVASYGAAIGLGRVDFSTVREAAWFALPRPLPMGIEFHWGPILILAFVYVISTMETIGDISGTLLAAGREPTNRELKGGLVADGVMSGFAALFGAFPNTSYSQNVGLVNFTGVASRHITAIAGLFLVVLGVVPKVSALFATLPAPVIGGGGLIMFAMIFASGAAIFHQRVSPSRRNLVILAVSIGLGLGAELRPQALQSLPEGVAGFLRAGLVTGGLAALLLNLILPQDDPSP
ncbi:MAG: purine permease [Deltaproteobacteria bacterium]|nr:purine permease [Deltaproteobacteria bacterium]